MLLLLQEMSSFTMSFTVIMILKFEMVLLTVGDFIVIYRHRYITKTNLDVL